MVTPSLTTGQVSHWIGIPQILRTTSVTITGLLSIIFNTMNLIILRRAPQSFGDTTSLILMFMAIVDISAGFSVLIVDNIENLTDIPVNFPLFCSVAYPLKGFFVFYSLSLLGILNLDRIILVTRPLKYFIMVTKCRVVATLALASILPTYIAVNVTTTEFSVRHRYCRLRSTADDPNATNDVIISIVAVFILCEVLFITYANIHLLYIACRQGAKMRSSTVAPTTTVTGYSDTTAAGRTDHEGNEQPVAMDIVNTSNQRPQRKPLDLKGLRTVCIVTIALYIATAPYFVRLLLNVFDDNYVTDPVFEFCGYLAGYSNSWWNPVIYLLMNSSYRHTAKRLFKDLC